MEAKFFKEIEKKMDVKILKDFEKEIRTKTNHELEVERKTNEDLARILLVGESQQFFFSQLWNNSRVGTFSWLKLTNERKKRLFKLIEIYTEFYNLVEDVESLNAKVEKIKQLKDGNDGD